jgi:hypothetical protein
MSRIFVSHASADNREAIAVKQWLAEQNPRLANEIFSRLRSGYRHPNGRAVGGGAAARERPLRSGGVSAIQGVGIAGGVPDRVPHRRSPQ